MQQPMTQQHDQIGAQQAMAQQMVLCPVRFVYETQILVQPGDQIQPNQTFFINPQNPPPWMQNSLQTRQAIQNPVVYVQQLTNNIMPSVQQPVDQNHLYLQQNFANFQIQQQMLAQQPQEMRPTMQLANIVPNIVQNMQTNMQNERTVNQNVQIQNAQMMQNQMNVNRQVQNQMVNQGVEVQRQIFMRPQIQQQATIQRPMANVNQIQNMQQQQQNLVNMANVGQANVGQTNVGQANVGQANVGQANVGQANVGHTNVGQTNVGQTFMSNVGRPPSTMNNIRASITNKVGNVQPVPKVRDSSPADMNKSVGSPIGNVVPNVRNFMPNNYYRPIQPRPQLVNNMANMSKMQQHIPVQTVQNTPVYNHEKNVQQNVSNNFAIIQQLNNPTINRKRKSESPDEIQKKIVANVGIKQNYPQQNITVTKIVNEMGTNTSPVHRPKVNTQIDMPSLQIIKTIDNTEENKTKEPTPTPIMEKDKLIRNTVYPQARGRVLQDKIDEVKPPITENITVEPVKITEETKPEIKTKIEVNIKPIEAPQNLLIENTIAPKTVAMETNTSENIVQKVETVVDQIIGTVNSVEENKKMEIVKDERPAEGNRLTIKQENMNILTHVVDGYVIQESNFAFPIRKPLKEKTIHTNLKKDESESKDLIRESIKEELKNNVDIPLLPFHYLLLDSAKEEKEKTEEKEDVDEKGKDNPFYRLQHSTIKSWTVEDLSSHLLKYNWKETVSLLQDHEIDGESLYLVSKQQLLTIGVTEDHADVICEFVKS